MNRLNALSSTLLALVASCGGATSTDLLGNMADAGTANLSVQQACANQSSADCALRDSCTNGMANQITYGSTQLCVSQLTATCVAGMSAPDTGNTVAHIEGCAEAYPGEACPAYWDNNTITACRSPVGPRANGAVCGASAQCGSAYCSIGPNVECGTCQPVPKPGDACEGSSNCQYDLDCPIVAPATSGVCTPRGVPGSACDDSLPCSGGLACIGSHTTPLIMGTCQAAATTVGAACNYETGPGCDGELYLFCASGTCQPQTLATGGQPCGQISDTSYAQCEAGGLCVKPLGSESGTCVAVAATGAACDSAVGPPCASSAKCISTDGGTSGTCVFKDPASCG